MKKLLTLTVLLTGIIAAQAYDYPYLAIQTNDGSTKTIPVESLVITFENGQLMVSNNGGQETFTLTDLKKMFFSEQAETTDITEQEADDDEVQVFTVGGIIIGKYENFAKAKASLKSGLYIIKSTRKTIKVNIK